MSVSLEDMITLKRVGFLADEVYSVRGFPSYAALSFKSCTYRLAPVSMSMTSSKLWCVLRLCLSSNDLKAKSRRPLMLTEVFLSINSPIYFIFINNHIKKQIDKICEERERRYKALSVSISKIDKDGYKDDRVKMMKYRRN